MTWAATTVLVGALLCATGIGVAILTYRAFQLQLTLHEKRLKAGDEAERDERVAKLERDVRMLTDRVEAAERMARDTASAQALRRPGR